MGHLATDGRHVVGRGTAAGEAEDQGPHESEHGDEMLHGRLCLVCALSQWLWIEGGEM